MAELGTNEAAGAAEASEVIGTESESTGVDESVELARLKSELAMQKAALDKATKEAAESKRALRARQSAEEAAAEEAREAARAQEQELAELRKKFATAELSKKAMKFVGEESVANEIAESLHGAENADAVLLAIQKAWTAKEKALRLELSTIPSPGIGKGDGAMITNDQLASMTYVQRAEFAAKYPDEYEHLMGRK